MLQVGEKLKIYDSLIHNQTVLYKYLLRGGAGFRFCFSDLWHVPPDKLCKPLVMWHLTQKSNPWQLTTGNAIVVKCQVQCVTCQVSCVNRLVSSVRWQGVTCQVSGNTCLLWNVREGKSHKHWHGIRARNMVRIDQKVILQWPKVFFKDRIWVI